MKQSYRLALFVGVFLQSSVWAESVADPVENPQYWQTEGYGYVLKVDNDVISVYDLTGDYCVYNATASAEFEGGNANQWFIKDASGQTSINWYALHHIELTAINSLPDACGTAHEHNADPVHNFDVFWSTYADHFPYGKVQSWDWDAQYPVWRSMVTEDTGNKELAKVLSLVVDRVRDGHAWLGDEEHDDIGEFEPRLLAFEYRLRQIWKKDDDYRYFWPFKRDQYRKWRKIIVDKYAKNGEMASHYDNFHFTKLENNLSYLRIDDMIGFTVEDSYEAWLHAVDDTMQKLLPELNKSQGLIIDLRQNGGGTDLVSMQLLSYLFKDSTQVGSKYTIINSKPGPEKPITVTPSSAGHYNGPVVVLTSQGTASAAEIMLIGLTARQNTTVIGEPSNGSFSDSLPKRLPNGWSFSLSHQVYLDSKGNDHEDIGIPVSEYFPFLLFDDLEKDRDPALERAMEMLQ